VMLEFIPYSQVRTLDEAHAALTAVAPANAGILVDALHLSRSGGTPSDLARYDASLFSYMHLCDAPASVPAPEAFRSEARGDRLYPGEGGLWLSDFVSAFPPGTPVAIEAPTRRYAALSPIERGRVAGASCRRLLESGPG
jgi:sugar phosphate isomerase/epimerase